MECAFFPPPPSVEEPDDVPILASSENAQNMLWGVVVEADTLVAFKRIVDGRRWPQNAAVTQQVRQHVWKKWIGDVSGPEHSSEMSPIHVLKRGCLTCCVTPAFSDNLWYKPATVVPFYHRSAHGYAANGGIWSVCRQISVLALCLA